MSISVSLILPRRESTTNTHYQTVPTRYSIDLITFQLISRADGAGKHRGDLGSVRCAVAEQRTHDHAGHAYAEPYERESVEISRSAPDSRVVMFKAASAVRHANHGR